MAPTKSVPSASGTLDLYTDYCAESDKLGLLILRSHDKYDSEIRGEIERQKKKVDTLLDKMIGGANGG